MFRYGPAINTVDKDILLLSWTYGVTDYDRELIAGDVDYMQNASMPWIGCGWMNVDNVQLWADAMVRSLYLYAPFFVQWGEKQLCVLDRHYAGTAQW